MTSSSVKSLQTSDPSIRVWSSEPSISTVRRRSRALPVVVIVVVVLTLGMVGLGVVHVVNTAKSQKASVAEEEAKAREIRRVNAQPIKTLDEFVVAGDTVADEGVIYFSLFSTPSGAEVYRDGIYVGTTPIEQMKLKRVDEASKFVVALEGYELGRRTIRLDETFSERVVLEERVVAVAAPVAASATADSPRSSSSVTSNNAVVVNRGQGTATNNDNAIVLPD
ncbi:MAG: PEGA domain-containing protein [Proteobacteria bacterium]|nr:PEGA domain-containing protein [Pseudomonadota bacterium]